MLVSQDVVEIEVERRTENGWATEMLRGLEAILRLDDLG